MLCRQCKSKPDARKHVAKIDFRIVGILGSHHVQDRLLEHYGINQDASRER